jgi:hypothetical protein
VEATQGVYEGKCIVETVLKASDVLLVFKVNF